MKKRNLLLFSILVLIIGSFILPSFVSAERTYYSPLADSVEEEGSWDAPLMLGPWNPVYDLFTSWSYNIFILNFFYFNTFPDKSPQH